jgi:enamine deaminase RidA (YjgF/YER057c/UK114 family)
MSPAKSFLTPGDVAPPIGNGYSHAVLAGCVIYVAGQLGMDPTGAIAAGFELLFEVEAVAVPD